MTKFYFTESQSFAGHSPKYIEISCLGHKLAKKVMRLHKIQVEKISWLLLNKYDVHNF